MSDKYFLDTNIFVYSFDHSAPAKQAVARSLIRSALIHRKGSISYQVVQEFFNVALKKFTSPLTPRDCMTYLSDVLAPLCEIFPGIEFYKQALQISERWKYSLYDSLIITAAVESNCSILYSEDLQHGRTLFQTTIMNPFRAAPAP